jgi:GxxExxY protein
MTENDIAAVVVDASFQIHTRLGPGLLETVYEHILSRELRARALTVQRQVLVPIRWDGEILDAGFRADLILNDLVIVELKSVEQIAKVHRKQLLTYLRLTDKRLGLLINFGANLMKEGLFRVVNGLPE